MLNSIAEIIIAGMIAAWLCRLARIPDLIGFLLIGILFGPYVFQIIDPSLAALSGELRTAALIVILLRAGFELHKDTLKKVGKLALLLAIVPPMLEAASVAFVASWLAGLSLRDGLMLGVILSAVSPAAVVPFMIRFREEKLGADKEIPAMMLAASSINNISVLIVFAILSRLYLSDLSHIEWQLISIPVSVATGIAVGALAGLVLVKVFDRFNPRATRRVLLIMAVAVVFLRIEKEFADWIPFAALLAVMTLGFVILGKRETYAREISLKLAKIWILAEMVLFTLVGAEVNLERALEVAGVGTAIIGAGLLIRSIATWLCLYRSGLTRQEKGFVVVSYIPKATVQAAIGAIPLVTLQSAGMNIAPGETILAIAVLSIVLTAPTGALGIAWAGKRWLKKGV